MRVYPGFSSWHHCKPNVFGKFDQKWKMSHWPVGHHNSHVTLLFDILSYLA